MAGRVTAAAKTGRKVEKGRREMERACAVHAAVCYASTQLILLLLFREGVEEGEGFR